MNAEKCACSKVRTLLIEWSESVCYVYLNKLSFLSYFKRLNSCFVTKLSSLHSVPSDTFF